MQQGQGLDTIFFQGVMDWPSCIPAFWEFVGLFFFFFTNEGHKTILKAQLTWKQSNFRAKFMAHWSVRVFFFFFLYAKLHLISAYMYVGPSLHLSPLETQTKNNTFLMNIIEQNLHDIKDINWLTMWLDQF